MAPISPRLLEPCSRFCLASVQPIVPLRSARTLLVTPALISDWVPMIERVRPAQLTMMVVSESGAARPARSTSSAPGTLIEPGMFMVAYSSKRRTSRI